MKVVYVLRHAKSSWKDPSQPDSDRPLAPRGRRAARAMADHLRREGIQPSLILCSPARRTRETLELVRAYYRIRSEKVRKRVFELAKALAKADEKS